MLKMSALEMVRIQLSLAIPLWVGGGATHAMDGKHKQAKGAYP